MSEAPPPPPPVVEPAWISPERLAPRRKKHKEPLTSKEALRARTQARAPKPAPRVIEEPSEHDPAHETAPEAPSAKSATQGKPKAPKPQRRPAPEPVADAELVAPPKVGFFDRLLGMFGRRKPPPSEDK